MKNRLLAGIAFNALIPTVSMAADLAPPVPPLFSWTGFYAGMTAGAAWGSYDPRTSTAAGEYPDELRAAAVTGAGRQSLAPAGFTTGIEVGYNWRNGPLLIGFEADLQALHLNRTVNSGAIPYPDAAGQFVVSAYGNANWLVTARPRIGWVAPNDWLFYVTGGFAATQLDSNYQFTDSFGVTESARFNGGKAGYAAGVGIEVPLADRLSLEAEYLYAHFGRTNAPVTSNSIAALYPTQVFNQSGNLSANLVRLGLNYQFLGGDGRFESRAPTAPVPLAAPLLAMWEIETGARLWFSSGKLGAPQPLLNVPGHLVASRLIYANLNGFSGETFARVDHSSGVFVKGYLGAGGFGNGKLDDEDFPAETSYSNTLSTASGHLSYGTVDVGYTFLSTPSAKVGAFIGYNYYAQDINTYGCTQLAADISCLVGSTAPNFLIIANDSRFNSMRLGLSAQFRLTERLNFTAEAAYMPWVTVNGHDDHVARQLQIPFSSSAGDGVMLEGILGYDVTDAWNVGIGARYWAWNTQTGIETFNFLTNPAANALEPARFTAERYGVFLKRVIVGIRPQRPHETAPPIRPPSLRP